MSEKNLISQILTSEDGGNSVIDAERLPDVIESIEDTFKDARRQCRARLFDLKQREDNELKSIKRCQSVDVNALANLIIEKENIERKAGAIEKAYTKLFGEVK